MPGTPLELARSDELDKTVGEVINELYAWYTTSPKVKGNAEVYGELGAEFTDADA
jgi:hypothetical protein